MKKLGDGKYYSEAYSSMERKVGGRHKWKQKFGDNIIGLKEKRIQIDIGDE